MIVIIIIIIIICLGLAASHVAGRPQSKQVSSLSDRDAGANLLRNAKEDQCARDKGLKNFRQYNKMGIHYRGVQCEGGAVDGGSII